MCVYDRSEYKKIEKITIHLLKIEIEIYIYIEYIKEKQKERRRIMENQN